jgi:hypothetical protein
MAAKRPATERPGSLRPTPPSAGPVIRKAPAGPRTLSSFLPGLTRKAFQKYGFASAALVTDWPNVVGPEIASYSVPERLKWPRLPEAYADDSPAARTRPGATLVLRVEGARALDLQYRSRQVIERVNAYFGYRAVAELRFVQAPIARNRDPSRRRGAPAMCGRPQAAAGAAADQTGQDGLAAALARLEANVRDESLAG